MQTNADGMPVLEPLVDDANTATFNTAFAQIGSTLNDKVPVQTFRWADATERNAQTGMENGDSGFQEDTGAWYDYISSAWVIRDTGWVNIDLLPGFSATDPIRIRRHGAVVTLRGQIDATGLSPGSSPNEVAIIPEGFRPGYNFLGFAATSAAVNGGELEIRSAGGQLRVYIPTASYASVTGTTWMVDL